LKFQGLVITDALERMGMWAYFLVFPLACHVAILSANRAGMVAEEHNVILFRSFMPFVFCCCVFDACKATMKRRLDRFRQNLIDAEYVVEERVENYIPGPKDKDNNKDKDKGDPNSVDGRDGHGDGDDNDIDWEDIPDDNDNDRALQLLVQDEVRVAVREVPVIGVGVGADAVWGAVDEDGDEWQTEVEEVGLGMDLADSASPSGDEAEEGD